MSDPNWELPVSFYFQVKIGSEEYAFKEVTGLSAEIETESIKEGGVNEFTYLLPKQVKHANLSLKRALNPVSSSDVSWFKEVMEGDFSVPILPRDIIVNLLGEKGTPIYTWTCAQAYPVKWEVGNLDSQSNSILIERIDFAYTTLKRS
ncbi:T4-like virus tail tube protein gp19 [compost metagenome]